MRIQHNIMAMSAYRNYNTNTSALSKNLERLSSGYKINRAGDDAAGLAISEKMRAQITGLEAAQKNVKDGISLVKTAEGAMQEIQDMLNRMDYLATQSANGTYDNEVDRLNLNKEMIALKDEINRIAESANFNGISLLDGSLAEADAVAADPNATTLNSQILDLDDPHFQTHKEGKTEQNPSFQIDLHEALEGATAKASLSTTATFSIKVQVGNQTITVSGLKVSSSVAAGGVIKASSVSFANASITVSSGKASSVSLTSGDATMKFKITGSTTGVLKFEKASGATVNFNANMNVKIAGTGTNIVLGAKGSDVNTGGDKTAPASYNCQTQKVVNGVKATGTQLAHGHVEIDEEMGNAMVNGGELKLAGQTITFSADASKTASGVVSVKDLATKNEDGTYSISKDDLAELTRRITVAAASNTTFSVGVGSTSNTTLSLQEKWNNATTNPKIDLSSTEEFQKQVNFTAKTPTAAVDEKKGLALQIGDTAEDHNRIFVKVGDMHDYAMGIVNADTGKVEGKTIADIDITTADKAQEAIDVIKGAINYVSGVRGDLGAVQNRLEHTANNLSVMAENIQDAESTIRDTDIAEEMMSYTKNNILVQSAQAMLAQANAVPQGVLQLLG